MHIGIIAPIACGKSTISKLLSDYLGYELMPEPVEHNRFLPKFYENPEKYAFFSQLEFYTRLYEAQDDMRELDSVVYDSCLYSNLVFNELMRMTNTLSLDENYLLHMIAKKHLSDLDELDYYIVLKRPKEVLIENQRNRGREIEEGQMEYLNFHYDNYYKKLKEVFSMYPEAKKRVIYVELGDKKYDKDNIHELWDYVSMLIDMKKDQNKKG